MVREVSDGTDREEGVVCGEREVIVKVLSFCHRFTIQRKHQREEQVVLFYDSLFHGDCY